MNQRLTLGAFVGIGMTLIFIFMGLPVLGSYVAGLVSGIVAAVTFDPSVGDD
jgi:hypothetical protein